MIGVLTLNSCQVFFYPKDNTPGCTKEAQAFNADLAQFSKLGAEVIGISSDDDHTDFVSKYGLKMKLLSDIGGKVRGPTNKRDELAVRA